MESLLFGQALECIHQKFSLLTPTEPNGNILLGVAGYVAGGKSRLCRALVSDIETSLCCKVIYLPFDFWINQATVISSTNYAGKFLLNDLAEALRCIRSGERFFVPRYDIMKTTRTQNIQERISGQKILWNGKSFVPYSKRCLANELYGSSGLYIEVQSGYVYSLFPAIANSTFVVDGTLIFSEPAANLYDLRIFVQASWPLRISRMIRRFNRKEVFGTTSKTMREYVGFLVEEAISCADNEIFLQANNETLIIESVPDTLSNYLDLAYLRWYMQQQNAPQWVTVEAVDAAMQDYIQSLKNEGDVKILEARRYELLALMESKHLFVLPDTNKCIAELAAVIH